MNNDITPLGLEILNCLPFGAMRGPGAKLIAGDVFWRPVKGEPDKSKSLTERKHQVVKEIKSLAKYLGRQIGLPDAKALATTHLTAGERAGERRAAARRGERDVEIEMIGYTLHPRTAEIVRALLKRAGY